MVMGVLREPSLSLWGLDRSHVNLGLEWAHSTIITTKVWTKNVIKLCQCLTKQSVIFLGQHIIGVERYLA